MRPYELSQQSNLLAADLLPAVAPRFRHNRSMPEIKAERKLFVLTFFSSLCATPERPSPGCLPPAVTAPGALATAGPAPLRWATTQIAPSTAASAPTRTPARHRPGCGSKCPVGCGTETDIPRRDRFGACPGTIEPDAPELLPRRKPTIPLESASGPSVNSASARSAGKPSACRPEPRAASWWSSMVLPASAGHKTDVTNYGGAESCRLTD